MSTPEQNKQTSVSDTPEKNNQTLDKGRDKRYTDLQSYTTKIAQENARLRATVDVLKSSPQLSIDTKLQQELDDLKLTDPDVWRAKLNEIENEKQNAMQVKIEEATKDALEETKAELQNRQLNDYNQRHQTNITAEMLEYDIPRRIQKKLHDGTITFEQFLDEAHKYIDTPKVVGDGNKTLEQPNITKSAGSSTPSKDSAEKSAYDFYNDSSTLF